MFRSKEQLNDKGRPKNIALRTIFDHAKQAQPNDGVIKYGLLEAIAANSFLPTPVPNPFNFKDSKCTDTSDCETKPGSGQYIKDDPYSIVDD